VSSKPRALRRLSHLDRYGLTALATAAGGLAAILILGAQASAQTLPPERDRWYLDTTLPAGAHATTTPPRDQWYLGLTTPGDAALAPGQVVDSFLAAQSTGDAEGALRLLTPDAVLEAAPPDACAPPNACVGRDEIQTNFISLAANEHPKLTPVEQAVDGDVVTTRVEVRDDDVRLSGFERYIVTTTATISGTQIVKFSVARDLSDSATAAFDASQHPQH
jgi:hypothetical protein